jgi:hypothetical protein
VFPFNVRKQASRLVPAAILILTLNFGFHAQGQTGIPCSDCTASCTDEFPAPPGCRGAACGAQRAACIAKCERACKPGPPVQIHPRYLVLTLLYAPPGCSGSTTDKCSVQGNVSYGSSASNGTQVSATASFQRGDKVGVGSEVASQTQDFQITTTDSTSETVTKTQGLTLSLPATQDGVIHDLDQFILLTDPVVTIQQTGSAALWSLGVSGGSFDIFPVTVGELRNPSTMLPDVARHLAALGFTNADFQTILKLDPFANASTSVDPSQFPTRYTFTGLQLGYEPPNPLTCTNGLCPCVNTQYPMSNETDGTIASSFQTQYSVTDSVGSLKNTGLVSETSFTWTATAALSNTVKNTQTATLTLACPSSAYGGPVTMNVYWDSLFGSFEFAPVADNIVVQQGAVTTTAGKVAAGEPVSLEYDGQTLRTFTDYRGHYKFVMPSAKAKPVPKEGVLSLKGEKRTVALRSTTVTEFRIP